ncbi:unnamed protein product, partial [Closterium sp. NIES-54]
SNPFHVINPNGTLSERRPPTSQSAFGSPADSERAAAELAAASSREEEVQVQLGEKIAAAVVASFPGHSVEPASLLSPFHPSDSLALTPAANMLAAVAADSAAPILPSFEDLPAAIPDEELFRASSVPDLARPGQGSNDGSNRGSDNAGAALADDKAGKSWRWTRRCVEEQVEVLKGPMHIAAGTPNRLVMPLPPSHALSHPPPTSLPMHLQAAEAPLIRCPAPSMPARAGAGHAAITKGLHSPLHARRP